MRVLQISANVSPLHGGPPELALNLNCALREQGHQATIVSSDALLTTMERQSLDRQFPPGTLHLCNSEHRFAEKLEWFRAIRSQLRRGTVVHIHGYYLWQTAATAALSRWYGAPFFVHCHGIFEPYQVRKSRLKKTVFDVLMGRSLLGQAAGLVFDTALEEQTALPPGRLAALPRFVIPPCPARDDQSSPVAGDTRPNPLVLFLARIAPKKRVDLVVAAMPAIMRHHPTVELHVAGDDAEGLAKNALQRLDAHARNAIRLHGFVQGEDKAALLAQSSVYVLPSENENFGISVAEALSAGVPVVISREVGLAAEVEEAGAGVILRELSADAVSDAVREVLADPEAHRLMCEAAAALGRRLYSAHKSVALAEAAYATATLRLAG